MGDNCKRLAVPGAACFARYSYEELAVRFHGDPAERKGRMSAVACEPRGLITVQIGDRDPSVKRDSFGEVPPVARAFQHRCCSGWLGLQELREPVASSQHLRFASTP